MLKLLEAIRGGRFLDLGGMRRRDALRVLAGALEACCGDVALAGQLVFHETECETGVGHGLAIPHVRCAGFGEISCVAGWARMGLDFTAPDGDPVRLVAAYCVPDSAKNEYLREISGLVRMVFKSPKADPLRQLADQPSSEAARDYLLGWLGAVPGV